MSSKAKYTPVSVDDQLDVPSDMQASLVQPAADEVLPTASTVPMIQVVAPATLPEGYEFDAAVGNNTIKVKVPVGGVEQGQKFEVPFPQHFETMLTGVHVPVGHWRDGICSIFSYGACHPHCWTSCVCALLAAGQVISRLKLTWYGQAGSVGQTSIAFKVIFGAVILYASTYIVMGVMMDYLNPNVWAPPGSPFLKPPPAFFTIAWIRGVWHWIYWFATAAVLFNLRRYVRAKYAIPASSNCAEDCCWSFWCPCLVSAQLLRHTTDYDVYPSTCCTETGLPPHAPSIV